MNYFSQTSKRLINEKEVPAKIVRQTQSELMVISFLRFFTCVFFENVMSFTNHS